MRTTRFCRGTPLSKPASFMDYSSVHFHVSSHSALTPYPLVFYYIYICQTLSKESYHPSQISLKLMIWDTFLWFAALASPISRNCDTRLGHRVCFQPRTSRGSHTHDAFRAAYDPNKPHAPLKIRGLPLEEISFEVTPHRRYSCGLYCDAPAERRSAVATSPNYSVGSAVAHWLGHRISGQVCGKAVLPVQSWHPENQCNQPIASGRATAEFL